MIWTIFEWVVLWPAKFVAELLVPVLSIGTAVAGFAAGFWVYLLTERPAKKFDPVRFQLMPTIYALLVGTYVLLVLGAAFTELPRAISRYLRD